MKRMNIHFMMNKLCRSQCKQDFPPRSHPGPRGAYCVLSTASIRHSAATRSSSAAARADSFPPLEWPIRKTSRVSAIRRSRASRSHLRRGRGQIKKPKYCVRKG